MVAASAVPVNSVIQVDNEQMQVTARNTTLNTLTVTRGVNGSLLCYVAAPDGVSIELMQC